MFCFRRFVVILLVTAMTLAQATEAQAGPKRWFKKHWKKVAIVAVTAGVGALAICGGGGKKESVRGELLITPQEDCRNPVHDPKKGWICK